MIRSQIAKGFRRKHPPLSPKFPTITVGFTTINREETEGGNYIDESWGSLVKGGIFTSRLVKRIILSVGEPEGDYTKYIRDLTRLEPIVSAKKLNVIEHTHKVYEEFKKSPTDYFLLCQDDVKVTSSFFPKIERFLSRFSITADVFSLYTPYRQVDQCTTGLWEYDTKNFYSYVCVLMKKDVVLDYLKSPYGKPTDKIKGADMLFKNFCLKYNKKIIAHAPNIATHIGVKSSLGHNKHYDAEYKVMNG